MHRQAEQPRNPQGEPPRPSGIFARPRRHARVRRPFHRARRSDDERKPSGDRGSDARGRAQDCRRRPVRQGRAVRIGRHSRLAVDHQRSRRGRVTESSGHGVLAAQIGARDLVVGPTEGVGPQGGRMDRRAQLSGPQQHAGDEGRRSWLLLPVGRRQKRGRHRQGRERGACRLDRRHRPVGVRRRRRGDRFAEAGDARRDQGKPKACRDGAGQEFPPVGAARFAHRMEYDLQAWWPGQAASGLRRGRGGRHT